MKKSVFVFFLMISFFSLFSQTREEIIATIQNAEKKDFSTLVEQMPDWSDRFSIDNNFDLTDLSKIRWVFYCDYYQWFDLTTMSFDFNIPEYQKIYKVAESGYSNYDYGLKNSFSIIAEVKPGLYISSPFSSKQLTLVTNKINNNTYSNDFFFNNGTFVPADGTSLNTDNLTGFYVDKRILNPQSIMASDDQKQIALMTDAEYSGTVSFQDDFLWEKGDHFFIYDNEKHVLFSDGTIGLNYYDTKLSGNDYFVIRILSFNDKARILILDTPCYSIPFVPMEDYFISEPNTYFPQRSYQNINIYSAPDFLCDLKTTIKTGYFYILDSSQSYIEHDDVISKWFYVKEKNTGTEGWVWGGDLKLFSNGPTDKCIQARYAKYIDLKWRITDKASILDNNVCCYTTPDFSGIPVGSLQKGKKVTIFFKSNSECILDDESWYWYLISQDAYPYGWVYGKYLDIEE